MSRGDSSDVTAARTEPSDVLAALATVVEPELDVPITDLGFVGPIFADARSIVVRLRLPSAYCSVEFAYLVVADAIDALEDIAISVRVVLDEHRYSAEINAALAADARSDVHADFLRKAHRAAMNRSIVEHRKTTVTQSDRPGTLTLRDIRNERHTPALIRRRVALGLSICPHSRVMVDGSPLGGRITGVSQSSIHTLERITPWPRNCGSTPKHALYSNKE